MLKILIKDSDIVPWEALIFITGNINYGGRVTDDWDRICLLAMLKKCYNIDILDDGYVYWDSYLIPRDGDLESYRTYIDTLPHDDDPEVFGLHPNA